MKTLLEEIAEAKQRKKAIRQRRKELSQRYEIVLNWLIGIDDNFVFGNDNEATEFINMLNSYSEKLAILVKDRQQRRLNRHTNR